MAVFALDDIRKAAEAKYAPVEVTLDAESGDVVNLVPVLRLPKEKRKELTKLQKSREGKEEGSSLDDLAEFLSAYIRVIADSKAGADKLLAILGDDIAQMSELVSVYNENSQPGEASPSES